MSKWEYDTTFPETDKLILLSKLFNCSIDYLLNNDLSINKNTIIENTETLKEDKTINKIFTTIWSASSFVITLVLIPGIGIVRGGARSWIGIGDFSTKKLF